MFIAGILANDNAFESVHAVFSRRDNLDGWLDTLHPDQIQKLSFLDLGGIEFPFFLIEEFQDGRHYFSYITEIILHERMRKLDALNDFSTIYFNLWRMRENKYNIEFSNESCLNGRDYHVHFMDHDLQQIKLEGLGKYWEELLTA